ncbi:unnamed protein product [Durusdinium trenchii]|uniref:Uncharacterized protein n=1 Tax=Durusdinium trenchii TaxID=1381693 RepID=A0ABP0LH00_9DINO
MVISTPGEPQHRPQPALASAIQKPAPVEGFWMAPSPTKSREYRIVFTGFRLIVCDSVAIRRTPVDRRSDTLGTLDLVQRCTWCTIRTPRCIVGRGALGGDQHLEPPWTPCAVVLGVVPESDAKPL